MTGTWTPAELAYLRRGYPNAPGCAECGHPMRPTEPDQAEHPLCDPTVVEHHEAGALPIGEPSE